MSDAAVGASVPVKTRAPRRRGASRPQHRHHPMVLHHMAPADALPQALVATADPMCYSQSMLHPEWRTAMD